MKINTAFFVKATILPFVMMMPQTAFGEISTADHELIQAEELLDLSLTELGNITVTVSDFDETRLNAASTVSIIEREDWQRLGARRPGEAVSHLPGVMLYPNVSTGWTSKVRGYTNVAPRGVAYRLDGVPLNSYRFGRGDFVFDWMGMTGIERIEMIHGPGSVHHGSDAFHGVYSIQTVEGDSNASTINSEIGSNTYGTAGYQNTTVHGQYINDVALQISYQGNQNKRYDYTDASTVAAGHGSRDEEVQNYTGIAKIRSHWNKPWDYQGAFYFTKSATHEFPGEGRFFGGKNQSLLTDQDMVSQDFDFLMGKIDLEYDFGQTITAVWSNFLWESQVDKSWAASKSGFQQQDSHERRIGSKLTIKQVENKLNTQWSAAVASNYSKVLDANQTTASAGREEELFSGKSRQAHALTLQAKTGFFDEKFYIDYGMRLDDYDTFGSHISPRVGLIYHPTDMSAIKLLYGQAFRAPSAAEQYGIARRAKGFEDLSPEVIDTYELVFMYHSDIWKGELVLFHSEWQDGIIVIDSSDPNFKKEYTNQEENSAKGIELKFNYGRDEWDFDYSSSFVESRNDSTETDYVAFPKWIQNIGVGYNLDEYDTSFYLSNRIFSHVQENPGATSEDLKLFWQANLNIQYRQSDQLTWTLNARNLFARDNFYPAVQFTENGHPAEPFNVGLSMDYTF